MPDNKLLWKEFFIAIFWRAFKTFCEALLATMTMGVAIQDIDWPFALGCAATAFVYTILINIVTGMPEAEKPYGQGD